MNTWLQENLSKFEAMLDELMDHQKPQQSPTPGSTASSYTVITQVDSDLAEETDSMLES